jgi:branched-chain amino acid transport system ATP-binding protein
MTAEENVLAGRHVRMKQGPLSSLLHRPRQAGTTVLLLEQNALAALSLSDRAHVIDLGRTTLSGTGAQLLADPRVRAAYLGDGVPS